MFSSPQVELAAGSTPCVSVGGDLFDYVPGDDGTFSFTVADVAGQGTAAALLTAVVQGLLVGQLGADRSLRYCNAGHNAPFLVTSTDLVRLEVGGTVVGLFDFSQYDTGETTVSPGDLLVVFSDGVTEALNAAGDEFEDERLAECLLTVRGCSAAEALAAVQASIGAFAGTEPPRDDMTVMVLRFA